MQPEFVRVQPIDAATQLRQRRSNIFTGLLLTGFGVGVYFWTTNRMRTTDVLADMGNELDQVRALKAEKKPKN